MRVAYEGTDWVGGMCRDQTKKSVLGHSYGLVRRLRHGLTVSGYSLLSPLVIAAKSKVGPKKIGPRAQAELVRPRPPQSKIESMVQD